MTKASPGIPASGRDATGRAFPPACADAAPKGRIDAWNNRKTRATGGAPAAGRPYDEGRGLGEGGSGAAGALAAQCRRKHGKRETAERRR